MKTINVFRVNKHTTITDGETTKLIDTPVDMNLLLELADAGDWDGIDILISPASQLESLTDEIEVDRENQTLRLAGTEEYMPAMLGNRIYDALMNNIGVDHLIKFWKNCLLNPDPVARQGLYGFLMHQGHRITKEGYFEAQKAVYRKETEDVSVVCTIPVGVVTAYAEEILRKKRGLNNYWVVLVDDQYICTPDPESFPQEHYNLYCLKTLWNKIKAGDYENKKEQVFTDIHTQTMDIKLGVPVTMPRGDCNSNPNETCSAGLHVGSMDYVGDFGHSNRVVLNCIIKPQNVVAVPTDYNNTKMRCCEYVAFEILGENLQEAQMNYEVLNVSLEEIMLTP
jgi:hypothetical protein